MAYCVEDENAEDAPAEPHILFILWVGILLLLFVATDQSQKGLIIVYKVSVSTIEFPGQETWVHMVPVILSCAEIK